MPTLFVHGGSRVMGDAATDDRLVLELAVRAVAVPPPAPTRAFAADSYDPWLVRAERATFAPRLDAAAIAVETARADVLLVAGADDAMWPSLRYAQQLAARRHAVGAPVEVVARDDAGHRPRLPGESPAAPSTAFLYGGTASGDTPLGRAAWAPILERLRPAQAAAGSR
ncbi:acyl-CoA thioester hydrolase/BAAT C-terminal domain-containing protein [Streptomyces sp. DG2A-72]|uniref:acyl-CoA thioester hydrolase/BAAT C-terminal domain-containing protein n=1 Tax=Streptomyces sp. DG2A-72 TaxID=3051386 RepID=UPI00265C2CFF|nr:acyl-CoA thioester hydrolase/BAAT C-terminal domain-containing protein [Streptomyces sp. DG2A-72]MDO0934452.1 acyl-CoA thioester hydrolase/BAAT C-terminal domain-containing protein [Streptomyces sp. DG2A-72]